MRARLWYESKDLTIRAYRGESVRTQMDQLAQLALGFDDPQYRLVPSTARLHAAMVEGRLRDTMLMADEGLAIGPAGIELAVFGARAAIWDGNAAGANRFLAAHAPARPGRRPDAMRAMIEAGIAQVEGRGVEARRGYADAQRRWQELGLVTWLALTQTDIVETGAMELAERRRAAKEALPSSSGWCGSTRRMARLCIGAT